MNACGFVGFGFLVCFSVFAICFSSKSRLSHFASPGKNAGRMEGMHYMLTEGGSILDVLLFL